MGDKGGKRYIEWMRIKIAVKKIFYKRRDRSYRSARYRRRMFKHLKDRQGFGVDVRCSDPLVFLNGVLLGRLLYHVTSELDHGGQWAVLINKKGLLHENDEIEILD